MAEKKKNSKQKPLQSPVAVRPAGEPTGIQIATARYEEWLSRQTKLQVQDVVHKHSQMELSPFVLMRATFYRFAEQWRTLAGMLVDAPRVLAVGDLHIENFGTWRDSEGRLVWGVNDFDECCYMPFAVDIVRLAASALLAIGESHLSISPERACDEILSGYKDALKANGRPFVLAEDHSWLRDIAVTSLKKPSDYWAKMIALPPQTSAPPDGAVECMERLMPERGLKYRMVHRVAGEGSLGKPRYTGIASWHGGFVARDVKALVPSAWQWANDHDGPYEILYSVILGRAVRCQDPIIHSTGQWVGRRIAPDCSRIELTKINVENEEANLLSSMGWETANIHLGAPGAGDAIKRYLKDAKGAWLVETAQKFVTAIHQDWEDWKSRPQTITAA
jgi:hypothetical protein